MPLTLTVSDNRDATGGVATISGASSPAAAVSLYRAWFQGDVGSIPWELVGSRSGNGTIAVEGPARNYYLWYAKSVDGSVVEVTQPLLEPLTNSDYEPILSRLVNGIVDRLKLLKLDDIGEQIYGSVIDEASSITTSIKLPGILVCRALVPTTEIGGSNLRDDVGHPIQVLIMNRQPVGAIANSGPNAPTKKLDLWRERCVRALRSQRVPGVPENYTCQIEPAMAIDPKAPAYEYVQSAFAVRCVCREPRGLQT